MFEGKHPVSGMPITPAGVGGDAESLRPLRWDELVARLAAVRDLHCAAPACDHSAEGSFDADSARKIAEHHNGKPEINLEASRNFKDAQGTSGEAVHDAGKNVTMGAVRK